MIEIELWIILLNGRLLYFNCKLHECINIPAALFTRLVHPILDYDWSVV